MKIQSTSVDGCFVLEPVVHGDNRGYFMETFKKSLLQNKGIIHNIAQENESMSSQYISRGLHLQTHPCEMAKMRRVTSGRVIDICLDVRTQSPTYGKCSLVLLSDTNKKSHFIPRGCAAGLITLEDNTQFVYSCDNEYAPNTEIGYHLHSILPNLEKFCQDNSISIDIRNLIMSEKDKNLPFFKQ